MYFFLLKHCSLVMCQKSRNKIAQIPKVIFELGQLLLTWFFFFFTLCLAANPLLNFLVSNFSLFCFLKYIISLASLRSSVNTVWVWISEWGTAPARHVIYKHAALVLLWNFFLEKVFNTIDIDLYYYVTNTGSYFHFAFSFGFLQ